MTDYVVHLIPGSPFARAVLATLEEKGAPYRVAPVMPGTLRSAQHLGRHAFGRVPVLEHGEFRLYETQAILRYLDRVLPEPALTPADPRSAARMDQLMNVNDWYLFHGVANVIAFQRIVGPRLMGLTPDEAAIAAAIPKARTVFDELARLLDFLQQTPEWQPLTAAHANLRQWLTRMQARASMRATTWDKVAAMAQAANAA